jgi:type II restriction enzyme
MALPGSENAVSDALRHGAAILKYISPNDVGLTGGHQYGFYLPKSLWQMYSPQPPDPGVVHKHPVRVQWQDGRVTDSVVTWYGKGTRSEYRLTRFGRDFPFLEPDLVGSLLVIIPRSIDDFLAYVLESEEDTADIQAKLGVEIIDTWAVYRKEVLSPVETENECVEREFNEFVARITDFPSGLELASCARDTMMKCLADFMHRPSDDRLMRCVEQEYELFKLVERKLCEPEIARAFKSIDEFLETANSILQRRKSRAGLSLEHHVEDVLKDAGVPFERQPKSVDGQPDIIIPSAHEYHDPKWPTEKLFVVGVKRTCRDRWRQVLNEATRLKRRHILTIQPGISGKQLSEMRRAQVTVVVPHELHDKYPPNWRARLLTVDGFIGTVRRALA